MKINLEFKYNDIFYSTEFEIETHFEWVYFDDGDGTYKEQFKRIYNRSFTVLEATDEYNCNVKVNSTLKYELIEHISTKLTLEIDELI